MKFCKKCNIEKQLNEFHKDKTKKDGLQKWCKNCRHNHFQSTAEIKVIYDSKYNELNKEKIKAKRKIYYLENRDKLLEKKRKWLELNPNAYHDWTLKNPDYFRIYAKNYKKRNPEKIAFKKHKRKMAKLNILGSHSLEEWLELLEKSQGWCIGYKIERHYVGKIFLTKDHIIPLQPKTGTPGTDYISNIQPLCRSCNASKGNRR